MTTISLTDQEEYYVVFIYRLGKRFYVSIDFDWEGEIKRASLFPFPQENAIQKIQQVIDSVLNMDLAKPENWPPLMPKSYVFEVHAAKVTVTTRFDIGPDLI